MIAFYKKVNTLAALEVPAINLSWLNDKHDCIIDDNYGYKLLLKNRAAIYIITTSQLTETIPLRSVS